jgi:hypothetical protein
MTWLLCIHIIFFVQVNMLKDSPAFKVKPSLGMFGNAAAAAFLKNLKFFFKKKFNMVCMFWIVLIC